MFNMNRINSIICLIIILQLHIVNTLGKMYFDPCSSNATANPLIACDENVTDHLPIDEGWPLERMVSTVVPVFFGAIGTAGFLGNLLVVIGKYEYMPSC